MDEDDENILDQLNVDCGEAIYNAFIGFMQPYNILQKKEKGVDADELILRLSKAVVTAVGVLGMKLAENNGVRRETKEAVRVAFETQMIFMIAGVFSAKANSEGFGEDFRSVLYGLAMDSPKGTATADMLRLRALNLQRAESGMEPLSSPSSKIENKPFTYSVGDRVEFGNGSFREVGRIVSAGHLVAGNCYSVVVSEKASTHDDMRRAVFEDSIIGYA